MFLYYSFRANAGILVWRRLRQIISSGHVLFRMAGWPNWAEMFKACILDVLFSNFFRNTGYPDWYFVVFLSTSRQISGDYLYQATIAFVQVPPTSPTRATFRRCKGGATGDSLSLSSSDHNIALLPSVSLRASAVKLYKLSLIMNRDTGSKE